MAKITLNRLYCDRKQDVLGEDEPALYIAGQQVWSDRMGKGDTRYPNQYRDFAKSVVVELKEKNGSNNYKLLGSWNVIDQPKTNDDLVAASAGYFYRLYYTVTV